MFFFNLFIHFEEKKVKLPIFLTFSGFFSPLTAKFETYFLNEDFLLFSDNLQTEKLVDTITIK